MFAIKCLPLQILLSIRDFGIIYGIEQTFCICGVACVGTVLLCAFLGGGPDCAENIDATEK